MNIRTNAIRLLTPFFIIIFILTTQNAYAGFLIPPAPCGFPEPPYKIHKKHHHKVKHLKVKRFVIAPVCVNRQSCVPEFVQFDYSPSMGNGRWVIYEYDNYAPDLTTGDDDPTIDPSMNIDK